MESRLRTCAFAVVLLGGCVSGRPPSPLDRFEARLAASDSATSVLDLWCAERRFAPPAAVTARQIRDEAPVLSEEERGLLGVSAAPQASYRHVRLSCGSRVLSDARNWYVPARLTGEMNEALATTTVPFGTVAAPTRFRRERLESRRGAALGCPVGTVLSQRALLRLPGGGALAVVTECYTQAVVAR